MKINEVSKLTGVTVRTLHYYDEIGLLKPSEITQSGYRLYDGAALEKLQQILFFRELDFSLEEIGQIMSNPHYDKGAALKKQEELLLRKRERLDGLIALIRKTIKGDVNMSFKEFDLTEIERHKKEYAKEVKARWGDTDAYRQSEEKCGDYSEAQWNVISGEGADILRSFAKIRHLDPKGEKARELVKKWQDYITANFYECTKQILSCLGAMYTGDERFTRNIDKNGEGTADFLARAIEAYCAG